MSFYDDNIVIKPLTKNKFNIFKLISFDTESYKYENEYQIIEDFKIGNFYDGKNNYICNNVEDIINTLEMFKNKYNKITIIAHNYKYDIRISDLLDKILLKTFLNLKRKRIMLDTIFYIKFESADKNYILQLLDTGNYWKSKLKDLAILIGEEKTANDYEYSLPPEDWNKYIDIKGEELVKKDTKILYELFNKFYNSKEFSLNISIAGTSFNTYRRDFLKTEIIFPKNLLNYAEKSYHGGIVMPYKLGEYLIYYYDINSLYPNVMKKHKYSYKFNKELDKFNKIEENIINQNFNYLLYVKYSGYGHSPVYDSYDTKLIPFLNNTQWITGNEYLALLKNDFQVEILKAYEFYNLNLFEEFVNYFYDKRLKTTNDIDKHFYKIILNSLYGKLGQHRNHTDFISIEELDDQILKHYIEHSEQSKIKYNNKMYSLYGNFITVIKKSGIRYNPLIASEITANARLLNYEYSKIIGWNNLIYTDTDSFFSLIKLDDKYIGKKLGLLKLETKGLFRINGNKDYEYFDENGYHRVLKGIKFNEIILSENFKLTNYFDNVFEVEQWSGIKNKVHDKVIIDKILKELKRENNKMRYVDNVGYEWNDKNEYDFYKKI